MNQSTGSPHSMRERLTSFARNGRTELIHASRLGQLETSHERLLGALAAALRAPGALAEVERLVAAAQAEYSADSAEYQAFLAMAARAGLVVAS